MSYRPHRAYPTKPVYMLSHIDGIHYLQKVASSGAYWFNQYVLLFFIEAIRIAVLYRGHICQPIRDAALKGPNFDLSIHVVYVER